MFSRIATTRKYFVVVYNCLTHFFHITDNMKAVRLIEYSGLLRFLIQNWSGAVGVHHPLTPNRRLVSVVIIVGDADVL